MADSDSSSSSSSSSDAIKYEIFLSFRGEDTRKGFVSHLHAALDRQYSIKTFMDDRGLQRGSEISPSLTEAIRHSKAAIVVLSESYASSRWCLDELVQILRRREGFGQIVVPVFYNVEPRDVRKQEGTFGEGFSSLRELFRDSEEKVDSWKIALSTVADLSGWDSSFFRSEAELIERIVEDVTRKLADVACPRDDLKGLVGIEERIDKVKSLLRLDTDFVRTVGIWGMGGIGKTTLARVLFDRMSSRFEGRCFLANIRETWDKGQKKDLKSNFLSELLKEENPYNARRRLCNKKVLAVLDDVNDQEQLEFLVGDCSGFGCGSRIIVTTRDMQMLRYLDADDAIYRVEELNDDNALKLFLLNAFKSNSQTALDTKLSKKVLNYAQGIPLALKVWGSFLRCKKKENWEAEMDKLNRAPSDKIQNVLRVSYDGLDARSRNIFLDIACFFKGKYRDYVEKILDAGDFFPKTAIDDLIEKSLITITDSNTLWMHDLLQEMGWEIVQSTKEPGKRSRLWIAEDILQVFKNSTGTETVEGIQLLGASHIENLVFGSKAFEGMNNLRFLKVGEMSPDQKLHFPGGLQYLPDSLRYLKWYNCTLVSFPSNFSPQDLVELDMSHSNLTQLWTGVQDLANLKRINLSCSLNLGHIPDLSLAPKLESLNLEYCISLSSLHPINLRISCNDADLARCVFRRRDTYPGTLNLHGCSSLKHLPNISGNVKYLHLGETGVRRLPITVGSLTSLVVLGLERCNFENLPSTIFKLKSLQYLDLSSLSSLNKFPEELPRNIVELDLSGTAVELVPSSIEDVSSTLEKLNLSNCKSLVSLPPNFYKLTCLWYLALDSCSKLEEFPEILEPMDCLWHLNLRETGISKLPVSLHNITNLQDLLLDGCKNLRFLPASIIRMESLERLQLAECCTLELFRPMVIYAEWPCSLRELYLTGSNFGQTIPSSIKQLSGLVVLHISNCNELVSLPELPVSLGLLDASTCTALETVSSSQVALVQADASDYRAGSNKTFLFSGCSKLDQNSLSNLLIEFRIRILRAAIVCMAKCEERQLLLDGAVPEVKVCFPSNEMPKWFSCQTRKSKISIYLPPNWHTNFIGFALCVILTSEGYDKTDYLDVVCEYYFKNNNGSESPIFLCQFDSDSVSWKDGTNHLLMWYANEDFYDYLDAVRITFDFYRSTYSNTTYHHHNISRCGVRLLYKDDAEEFGISNSDIERPWVKRAKLSN